MQSILHEIVQSKPHFFYTRFFSAALAKPPTNLRVTHVTPTSMKLSWLRSSNTPHAAYAVLYCELLDDGGGQEPAYHESVLLDVPEFTLIGLMPFTQYEMKVVAINSMGRSAPSSYFRAFTAQSG